MTQEEQVYQYMQEHDYITSMEAFRYLGVTRLSAKIFDLRQNGHVILTEPVIKQNRRTGRQSRFLRYYIAKD